MWHLSDDSGLSLAELLAAMAIMGFVMASAYMVLDFTYKANAVAETQAEIASSISAPLEVMDSTFSQNVSLVTSSGLNPYVAEILLPTDYDPGAPQRRRYTATSNGRLVEEIFVGSATTPTRTVVWSTANVNRATGQPMFDYLGETTVTPVSAGDVRGVRVILAVRSNGTTVQEERVIYFRNRD